VSGGLVGDPRTSSTAPSGSPTDESSWFCRHHSQTLTSALRELRPMRVFVSRRPDLENLAVARSGNQLTAAGRNWNPGGGIVECLTWGGLRHAWPLASNRRTATRRASTHPPPVKNPGLSTRRPSTMHRPPKWHFPVSPNDDYLVEFRPVRGGFLTTTDSGGANRRHCHRHGGGGRELFAHFVSPPRGGARTRHSLFVPGAPRQFQRFQAAESALPGLGVKRNNYPLDVISALT